MAAKSLTYLYKTAPVHVKLIALNALVFIVFGLISLFFQIHPAVLNQWFVLPEAPLAFMQQPWSIITYAFLHKGFLHLLFNMLWLYWFGNIVLNLFDSKRFLTIYFLGAIAGGLLYIFAFNLFPVFEQYDGVLLGASGAVAAIIIFIATYTPNTAFRFFTLTIKLWHIGAFLFLADIIRLLTIDNKGGWLAHIGGAIFGYVYAQQLAKGNDIGAWFTNFLNWMEGVFTTRKTKPFKKVHRTTTQKQANRSKHITTKNENQNKIDAILDKIGKSGYESLTKAEKDFLFKAGKD